MGEHLIDHNTKKTKDNMENLENSLSHLTDQIIYIIKHQEYQRVSKYFTVVSANTILHDMTVHTCTSHNRELRRKDTSSAVPRSLKTVV